MAGIDGGSFGNLAAWRQTAGLDSSMAVRQHGYFPGGEIGHAASSHCVCNKAICVEKIIHLAAERRMEVNFFRVGNGGSMRFAGIDIGSRTIELVVVNDAGEIKASSQADTGFDPITEAKKMVHGVRFDRIMATGYGRNLFEIAFDAQTVTEIKAHAKGARAFFPESKAVLDIGGQDSKAISLFENGKVKKFEMNDRCAAGTGKFLEIMAKTLGYDIEEFGREALLAESDLNISSMCTVFAESEVTSLIAKGNNRREIARGLHTSVIRRAAGMINRVASEGNIIFTGGVAQNPCMVVFLAEKLGRQVLIPEKPQFIGALGAALLASEFESTAIE